MRTEIVAALALVGGIGFATLMVFLAVRHNERAHRNREQLARRLGLMLPAPRRRFGFWLESRATGRWRDRPAELYAFTTGSGKSRVRWAALAVTPTATAGLTFRITRQGLGSRIFELFGAREITVGDRAFDEAWFVQTNEPEFLRAALIPELRARLTAATDASGRAHRGSLKLENGLVLYAEAGDFADDKLCERMARIAGVLGDLADVAEVFAQSRATS